MNEIPSIETIKNRYSCRSYTGRPLSSGHREELEAFIGRSGPGPFGSRPVYKIIASEAGDSETLKGLGTYGFIRNPGGFIVCSVNKSPMYLEDFGFCTERIILKATEMGLGTCWLGGSFRKSAFAAKAGTEKNALIPSVIATGYIAGRTTFTEKIIRAGVKSDKRKRADSLFFSHEMGRLGAEFYSSPCGTALEMVRIAPSASNKQPWRVVRDETEKSFHFFMERTPGYNNNPFLKSDLQRIDMGIAMYHFEAAMQNAGLKGSWDRERPAIPAKPDLWKYTASWTGE